MAGAYRSWRTAALAVVACVAVLPLAMADVRASGEVRPRAILPGLAIDLAPPPPSCLAADEFSYANAVRGPVHSLNVFVESSKTKTGQVTINGIDTRQPSLPFTFDWGDGSRSDTFFPATHIYASAKVDYVVVVTAHYSAAETDQVQVTVRFKSLTVIPAQFDPATAVVIPAAPPPLSTRQYNIPLNLTGVPDAALENISRAAAEQLLTVAAQIQLNYANGDVERVGSGFNQVVLADPNFTQGMYSLWYTTPVALAIGSNSPIEGNLSSIFHEMGHNVTLNSPAAFRYGGRIDGPANAIYSETMAQIFQHATAYDLVRQGADFGLGCDTRVAAGESALSSFGVLRSMYENYLANGMRFASWNDPATSEDETTGTFATLAFKFFELAESSGGGIAPPLERMMAALGHFDSEFAGLYAPSENTAEADGFRSTLMIGSLSAAFERDLRPEFRALGFPVDDLAFAKLAAR